MTRKWNGSDWEDEDEDEVTNENCLYVKLETLQKMLAYAELAEKDKNEIGGLMIIDEPKEGGLVLEDIVLPEQQVGGASFKLIPQGKWIKDLKDSGNMPKIKGWWHSHRHMGTFYSGTDDNTLEDKWNGESPLTNHYAIGVVVSLPSFIKAWICYYKPIQMKKAELPVKILYPPLTEAKQKELEAEVKLKVKDYYTSWNEKNFKANPQNAKPGDTADSWNKKNSGKRKFRSNFHVSLDDKDPATGYTYRQLEEYGLWSQEAGMVSDIEEIVEPRPKGMPEYDERICMHQCYNEVGRIICWKFGKNFDCEKCDHKIDLPKNTKKCDPPASQGEAIKAEPPKALSSPQDIEKSETKETK